MMRKKLRDNGLTLTMLGLFALFVLGQSIVGYYDANEERYTHQQPPIHYAAYLTSAHLWARIFENWESEFLGSSPSLRPGLSPCTISQDPSFPVVFMSQSKGPTLNQLDFVVDPFGHAVGVAMPTVACNWFKPPT
jgi:hypothetical protein